MKAERAVRKVILEQPALNTKVFSTSVFSPSSLSTEIFIFTVTATNLNGGKLELKDIRRVTYYSCGNQSKSGAFTEFYNVSQFNELKNQDGGQ